jgi:hypothetical protein
MIKIALTIILLYFFIYSSFCALLTLKLGKDEIKNSENQTIIFKFIYYYGYIFTFSFPFITIIFLVLLSLIKF